MSEPRYGDDSQPDAQRPPNQPGQPLLGDQQQPPPGYYQQQPQPGQPTPGYYQQPPPGYPPPGYYQQPQPGQPPPGYPPPGYPPPGYGPYPQYQQPQYPPTTGRPNHLLHLILTAVTVGAWGTIWFVLSARYWGVVSWHDPAERRGMNRRTVLAIVAIFATMFTIGSLNSGDPKPTAHSFTDGTWVVGKDIKPGKYRSTGTACIWERLSSLSGSSDAVLDYGDSAVPVVVTIKPTDKAFESTGCGTWAKI